MKQSLDLSRLSTRGTSKPLQQTQALEERMQFYRQTDITAKIHNCARYQIYLMGHKIKVMCSVWFLPPQPTHQIPTVYSLTRPLQRCFLSSLPSIKNAPVLFLPLPLQITFLFWDAKCDIIDASNCLHLYFPLNIAGLISDLKGSRFVIKSLSLLSCRSQPNLWHRLWLLITFSHHHRCRERKREWWTHRQKISQRHF